MSKKNDLLFSLLSKSPNQKYKRLALSPMRYAGGKSLAVGYVLELIPEDTTEIISPFIGGGSIEIALANKLGIRVQGFDIFDLLVNFWQVLEVDSNALADRLALIEPTTENYKIIKERLKSHWLNINIIEDKLDLAAFYFFNHNCSFGPGFLGWTSYVYMNSKKWNSMIHKIRTFNSPLFSVALKSFEESILENPNTLIYADPPYFLGGDSKMFKGIYPQRNFPIHHNSFDHNILAQLLLNHPAGFILSYNDCKEIRELYKGCNFSTPEWQYTMGQGETRIGKNRQDLGIDHIKKSHELLIWKLPNDSVE